MTTLAEDLVPDELWVLVEPLLPAPPRPPDGGRHRTISDRAGLAAIVDLARTSTRWRLLPARELGCGSPATCWRRLAEWADAGVFDALPLRVLDRLGEQGQLDWEGASVDSASMRAKRGGTTWAQVPSIVASLGASCSWAATVAGRHGRRATDPHAGGPATHPARQGSRRQGRCQPSQPDLLAPAWEQAADRSA